VLANSFYENNHINTLENEKLKNNWLILLQLVNNILKDMLNLLSIKIPNKM
jgi:arginyl-tRNA synthetase